VPRHDTENVPDPVVTSPLFLHPVGGKWLETAPEGLMVGAIRLRGWDVHAVEPLPANYVGQDVYLVKLAYELDLDPGAPRPRWMEVGFSFRPAEEAEEEPGGPRATLLDALPHTVDHRQPPQGYQLNGSMMFVPHHDPSACAVFLGDTEPAVDAFGIGGPEIRWRHTAPREAPMRLGSRIGWIVLSAPSGTEQLTVCVSGRFEVRGVANRPGTSAAPVRFRLGLRPSGTVMAALTAPQAPDHPHKPRIFICYAHEDTVHCDRVRAFADFLMEQGCDVGLDAYVAPVRQNWDRWSTEEMLGSHFTAVIASPLMRTVGDRHVDVERNRGLRSELDKLAELLQRDRAHWTKRILPVILPGGRIDDIPLMLHPRTEDHYRVTSLTVGGAAGLLEAVFHKFVGRESSPSPATADADG
jgi:hypothetical protein